MRVTIIMKNDRAGIRTYRIEGEPTDAKWRASIRRGRTAWCEFAIYNDSDLLASYGGEVWPTAWPELFMAIPASSSAGSGSVRITDACKVLLVVAHDIAHGAPRALLTNQTIRELGGQS